MVNKDKFKGAIRAAGYTIPDFCTKMGISVSSFYRKMERHTFTIAEAERTAEILNLEKTDAVGIFFATGVA